MYEFIIASTPAHYRHCHQLARAEKTDLNKPLSFPTIVAYEDKQCVGFVSTYTQEGLIVAGPMVIKSDKRRAKLALTLAENYETTFRNLGITSFIMSVEDGSVMHEAIKRYTDMEPYASDDTTHFYVRRL